MFLQLVLQKRLAFAFYTCLMQNACHFLLFLLLDKTNLNFLKNGRQVSGLPALPNFSRLVEHFLLALVATEENQAYDHSGKEHDRGHNPCGRMSAGHLEEQHREAPADNCLEYHHERSVEASEFAEGRTHRRQARHIEQDK